MGIIATAYRTEWNTAALTKARMDNSVALNYLKDITPSLVFLKYNGDYYTLGSLVDSAYGLKSYVMSNTLGLLSPQTHADLGIVKITDRETIRSICSRLNRSSTAAAGIFLFSPVAVLNFLLSRKDRTDPLFRLKKAFGLSAKDYIPLIGERKEQYQPKNYKVAATPVTSTTEVKPENNGHSKAVEVDVDDDIDSIIRLKLADMKTKLSDLGSKMSELTDRIILLEKERNNLADSACKLQKQISKAEALLELAGEV